MWNHWVNEAQQQGTILADNAVDAALLPAAAAGAQLYAAGAVDMKAQFGQRGQLLSNSDKLFLKTAFPNVYTDTLLNEVIVYYGCTMPNSWYTDETQGMTFGHDIYLAPSRGSLSDGDRLTLIGHELIHALQYDRLNQSLYEFGYEYFQQYSKSIGSGDAYRNNSMEQEAYNQEAAVRTAYNRAVKLHNSTASTLIVTVTYEIPNPNPTGGLYLTAPPITLSVQTTISPGQTVVLYDANGQFLPINRMVAVGGLVQIQGSGPNDSWTYYLNDASGTTDNTLTLYSYFGGI